MKLAVIIPTFHRKEQLLRLIAYLGGQTRLPDEVILSAPDSSHIALPESCPFPLSLVFGPAGSSVQRNAALDTSLERFDVLTLFDDDFVPCADYLEQVEKAFEGNEDWAVMMGHVVRDGAANAGLTWEDAEAALREAKGKKHDGPSVVDHVGAYGCNMSLRAAAVGNLRFDERLVLYGWQEDIDFTSRLRSRGRVVCKTSIVGVHLGIKTGRVSGKRFGYSQVANPIYLIRKGSVPASFALPLMFRNIAANLAKSLRPEPYVDRRGRLRGNLLAILHVAMGRIEPEYILNL